jgi:hypothetical protein
LSAFETTFRGTGIYRKVRTSFLKMITERIFIVIVVRNVIGASRNLIWIFCTKRHQNCAKPQQAAVIFKFEVLVNGR